MTTHERARLAALHELDATRIERLKELAQVVLALFERHRQARHDRHGGGTAATTITFTLPAGR